MFLLDTDVVWALRGRGGDAADDPLFEWVSSLVPGTLFLSVVTMTEFESGIARLERRDKASAAAIRDWLENRVRPAFQGRVLAIDDAVVRRWAKLGYGEMRDGLLAATALEHGLTLATRDGGSFKAGKVKTFNPWTFSPDASDLDWREAAQSGPAWLKNLFVRG
jgi:hypothetical protein